VSRWIEGYLDPYWEQGWEGSFQCNLTVPDSSSPYFLEQGDLLDILDPDGQLLWSGTFQLRKRRFWERHKLSSKVYSGTTLKGLSYGQWMEWQWSSPRLKARVLRPDKERGIVYAWHGRHRERPPRLRDAGVGRCLGRKVLKWNAMLGSYGMGGPGFFGMRLEKSQEFPEEWFTLTVWGAGDWLLVNGRWVTSHPRYYDIQKPLYLAVDGRYQDGVAPLLVGAVIESVQLEPTQIVLTLMKGIEKTTVTLPKNTDLLPKLAGIDQPRAWKPGEDVRDAWVFHQRPLYC
jgi:hypothetical protein